MSTVAISVRGKVRNIGKTRLYEIFEKNPYMAQIYPKPESRSVLEVFEIYQGEGELFDLSCKPIYRENFTFGDVEIKKQGFFITENCTGCRTCYSLCPQNCIEEKEGSSVIIQENCLHCGKCMEVCPYDAIKKR